MPKLMEIYKCNICGNIVEILYAGDGELVCCGKPMELLTEKSEDTLMEKHKPVITFEGETKTIRVGSIPHPMEDDHYIMFIEAISPDQKFLKRKYLHPHEEPKMEFKHYSDHKIVARELCNIHGLWKAEEE